MRVFREGVHDLGVRTQPWTGSNHLSPGRYYNFRENPELIHTSLEDFLPFSDYAGVDKFYSLLEWLNGPESSFETNDSRLDPIFRNKQRDLADRDYGAIFILGFFFRDLTLNLSSDSPIWHALYQSHKINADEVRITPNDLYQNYITNFHKIVERSSGNSWPQIVGIGTGSTFYEAAPVPEVLKHGCQFFVRGWLWGNDRQEIIGGLGNVSDILRIALVKSIPR